MVKWILLSVVGVLCISVWSFVAIAFLSTEESKEPFQANNEMTSVSEEKNTKSWDQIELIEENNENVSKKKEDLKTRGIQKGDFADVAPDGEISIDDLLTAIKE